MDINKDEFNHYDMILWDMIRSLSDAKELFENSAHDIKKQELKELKNKFMEVGEWIKNRITE